MFDLRVYYNRRLDVCNLIRIARRPGQGFQHTAAAGELCASWCCEMATDQPTAQIAQERIVFDLGVFQLPKRLAKCFKVQKRKGGLAECGGVIRVGPCERDKVISG